MTFYLIEPVSCVRTLICVTLTLPFLFYAVEAINLFSSSDSTFLSFGIVEPQKVHLSEQDIQMKYEV